MSISITSEETIKSVAVFSAELTHNKKVPFQFLEFASLARSLAKASAGEGTLPNTIKETANLIANKLAKNNESTFKERYKDWEEYYGDSFSLEDNIFQDDHLEFRVPMNAKGMAYMSSALSRVGHGMDSDLSDKALYEAIEKLALGSNQLLFEINHPDPVFGVAEFHDSLIKVSQGGDHFYNLQSAFRELSRPLEMQDQNKIYYPDDVLMHVLDSALESKNLILPGNGDERLVIDTENKRSNSAYRIASDIPEPTEGDLSVVLHGFKLANDYLKRVERAQQPNGDEYPDFMLNQFKHLFNHVYNSNVINSQSFRRIYDGDKSFSNSMQARRDFEDRNVPIFVVGPIDDLVAANSVIAAANLTNKTTVFNDRDELNSFMNRQEEGYTEHNVMEGLVSRMDLRSPQMSYVNIRKATEALIIKGFERSIEDFGDYLNGENSFDEIHIKNIMRMSVSPYVKGIPPEDVNNAIEHVMKATYRSSPESMTGGFLSAVGFDNMNKITSLEKPEVKMERTPEPDIQNAPSLPPRRM